MPLYNQIYKATLAAGGGILNLPCADSTVNRYVFSGTAVLLANYTIQPSGTPLEGMEFDIRWQAALTLGANSVTIFGTALTVSQALQDLQITCYYNGSAWDVDIISDGVANLWEFGSGGITSAKLINASGTTATATNSVSVGVTCTSSGTASFTSGYNNDATANYSTAMGSNGLADGISAFSCNEGNTATGESSFACGDSNLAFGQTSFVEGSESQALGDFTHAGGVQCIAERYGQWSRASGRHASMATEDFMQVSKLTLWNYTTNATPVTLRLDGTSVGAVVSITQDSIIAFTATVVALQTGGTAGTAGDNASWYFNGVITNVAGTTSLTDTVMYQDNAGAWGVSAQRTQVAAMAAATVAATANNATDTLDITATGIANKNILWLCTIELTEIKFGT